MPRKKPIEKLSPAEPDIEISHPDAIVLGVKPSKRKSASASSKSSKPPKPAKAVLAESEPEATEEIQDPNESLQVSFRKNGRKAAAGERIEQESPKPTPASKAKKQASKPSHASSEPVDSTFTIIEWRSTGKKNVDASSIASKQAEISRAKPRTLAGKPKPEDETDASDQGFDLDAALTEFSVAFRTRSGATNNKGLKRPIAEPEEIFTESLYSLDPQLEPELQEPLIEEPLVEEAPMMVPPDAPQVITRNGIPTLVKGQVAIPPLFFSVFDFEMRSWSTIAEQIKHASEAGINLVQLGINFSIGDSVDSLLADARVILERVVGINPSANISFLLHFKPPYDWKQQFPNSINGRNSNHPSTFDQAYWDKVEAHLYDFTSQLRSGEFGSHVIGFHLGKTPWKREVEEGYDLSPAAEIGFRKWCRSRYQNDIVTLRAAWFDGQAEFDSITIPDFAPEGADGERFVRSSRKQRRVVDYHLFLSDATMQRIRSLAATVKRASDGWFLVGVSYGFTFEWSHPYSGHLALGKLLRAPEIDFISGPPSYRERTPGGTATIPLPVDSCALNGKLFISDEDFKTSLSTYSEDDSQNPVLNNPQALEAAHWRGAGAAVAHASGLNWCDSYGRGWLNFPGIWQRASSIKNLLIERMSADLQEPEVVIFIDERSLAYLVDPNAFLLLVQNVCDAAHRAGLRIGYYLLSDLAHRERFPDAKLYIFLNAWDMRSPLRSAVQSRLHCKGKVLLWLYAAALFDGGRDAMDRVREVVGIALKPQPFFSKSGTVLVDRRHALSGYFPDQGRIGGSKLEPSYFAVYDENLEVLGEYLQSGLPSFALKTFGHSDDPESFWTSIFLGEPLISPGLIRGLGHLAGAHQFDIQEDTVNVSLPFVSIHVRAGGSRTVPLPAGWIAYDVLTGTYPKLEGNILKFVASENSTYTFLIGGGEEIERIIRADAAKVLEVGELPERDLNIRLEKESDIDIPILKFADYVEDALPDEVKEEWLLQPIITFETEEFASESDEDNGSYSRNRRQNRRKKRGRQGQAGQGSYEPETGISAFFRKRV